MWIATAYKQAGVGRVQNNGTQNNWIKISLWVCRSWSATTEDVVVWESCPYPIRFNKRGHITKKKVFCSSEYDVDASGVVYSKRGKPLKPSLSRRGYYIVNLMVDGKRIGISVHTLVARAFVDGYSPEKQVNHKDGDKLNNKASNLEWVTAKENTNHAICVLGKKSWNARKQPVIGVSNNCTLQFDSVRSAAKWLNEKFSTSSGLSLIWRVLKGLRKTTYGYTWKYA